MPRSKKNKGKKKAGAGPPAAADDAAIAASVEQDLMLPLFVEEQDVEGGDQVVPLPKEHLDPERELESFRHQWKSELTGGKHLKTEEKEEEEEKREREQEEKEEEQARQWFLEGVELERKGDMSEAVRRYTKAFRLVPDIERRVCPPQVVKQQQQPRVRSSSRVAEGEREGEEEEGAGGNLVDRLTARMRDEYGGLTAQPDTDGDSPFCWLSAEVVHLLLRTLVSRELDVRSLEAASGVCAAFYVAARDSELWRAICHRSINQPERKWQSGSFSSWRDVWLASPHLLHHGIYASKSTYIRHGETGFQDQNYRPWHSVTYYRVMRFFADGDMLMMTSSDAPAACVSSLRERVPKESAVLAGKWRIEGEMVYAKVCREAVVVKERAPAYRKRRGGRTGDEETVAHGVARQEFSLQLRLQWHERRKHWGLVWVENVCTVTYLNGTHSMSDLDVQKDQTAFPALRFLRVPGFPTEESDSVL